MQCNVAAARKRIGKEVGTHMLVCVQLIYLMRGRSGPFWVAYGIKGFENICCYNRKKAGPI